MDVVIKFTSASRMKKSREKLKAINKKEYLKSERTQIAELRKKKKGIMTEKDKDAHRLYEQIKKRLQRAKAKHILPSPSTSKASSSITPYSCKQTLSKAVLKTARALPNSPRKQKAVVTGLAKRIGIQLANEMEEQHLEGRNGDLEEATVVNFFYRPEIVYTCPGMKDVLTIWKDGEMKKLQKHYMTMFLKEAFYIFKEEHPDYKIGLSKFCSLRPKNVLCLKETSSEQCKSRIHENFMYKLKALKYNYNDDF